MRDRLGPSITLAVATAAGLLWSGAAEARLFVLKSDVAAYPARSVIEPGQKLSLPSGKSLTVLLPDGTMRELTSANNGPVQALLTSAKPASWWDDLVKLVMSGGGVDKPGSVRSAGLPPVSFAVEGVRGGNIRVCVERGGAPTVTRDRALVRQVVSIVAGGSTKPVVTEFAAGESTLKWPSGLEVADGQTYRVMPLDSTALDVRVTLIAKKLPGTAAVPTLAEAGCLAQAAALLQVAAGK
jgi:hypothetical protein